MALTVDVLVEVVVVLVSVLVEVVVVVLDCDARCEQHKAHGARKAMGKDGSNAGVLRYNSI